jgi:hypothetical protein
MERWKPQTTAPKNKLKNSRGVSLRCWVTNLHENIETNHLKKLLETKQNKSAKALQFLIKYIIIIS